MDKIIREMGFAAEPQMQQRCIANSEMFILRSDQHDSNNQIGVIESGLVVLNNNGIDQEEQQQQQQHQLAQMVQNYNNNDDDDSLSLDNRNSDIINALTCGIEAEFPMTNDPVDDTLIESTSTN